MKNLYILLSIFIFLPSISMELPSGPEAARVENYAKTLASSSDKEEKEQAYNNLEKLAQEKNPAAIYTLAVAYEYGVLNEEKKPNFLRAFKGIKQAADLGYGPAFIILGKYYLKGMGTKVSPELAARYYTQADLYYKSKLKQTDVIADYNAKNAPVQRGLIYLTYFKDDKAKVNQALEILADEAERNLSQDAAYALAKYFEEKNDPIQSEKYYLMILNAKPDDIDIQVQLSNMYLSFFSEAPEKVAQAIKYLDDAVQKYDNPVAALRLASYYSDQGDFQKTKFYLNKVPDEGFASGKHNLLGLFYLNNLNPEYDIQKAYDYFEKALSEKPNSPTALLGIWKVWLASPELITDEARINDIISKVLATKEPQIAFEIALGYTYGIYGLEKDPVKAKKYFKKVFDDTSVYSDGFKALMYRDGLYVKQNFSKGLEVLERSRSKNPWNEQLYKQLKEKIAQELIQEEELGKKKSSKKLSRQIPQEAGQAQQAGPALLVENLKISQPEREEFDQEPQNPSQIQEFKHGLIADINTTYKPDDGSYVEDIDLQNDIVTINDPRHDKKIVLNFKDLPKNKRFKRVIKKLQYHPRVQEWFTLSPEQLQAKYPDPTTIENHTFAQIVDSYIQLYGTQVPRKDNRQEFIMHGDVINTRTNKKRSGTFEYTFYQDNPGGPWVLHHRLFRPDFWQHQRRSVS